MGMMGVMGDSVFRVATQSVGARTTNSRAKSTYDWLPLADGVKHHAGQTVAGRFGQAHIAGNDRVKHFVAKVGFELLAHLHLQGDARVKHDAQQANDFEVFVQIGVHLLDGVDQVGQPFQRKVFALHGHNHAVR